VNILILTVGTRGDVQPYIALGKGLAARGHAVSICTSVNFSSFVNDYGLGYAHLNDDVIRLMHSEEGKFAMENSGNWLQAIRTGLRLFRIIGPMQRRHISDTWVSTRGCQPDLILFHPKAFGAAHFAERLNVPCIFAFYLPMYAPTGEFPAMGMPHLRLGRWYNRLTYRFMTRATWMATGKYINEWRRDNGMQRRRCGLYLRRADGEPMPALHAYSESVIPQPADWPETTRVTGYWFLDRPEGWRPPAELEAFLSPGPPPVYVGFGSVFGRDPARLTRIVVEAVRGAGLRAIIARGWGGLEPARLELPPTILRIDEAPHDWLFPRVAAVVHHGGCGTTAAGLRAGRPTVVCPLFGDQPFWGAKVEALGVGSAPIPQKKLNREVLTAALIQVTRSASIKEKAHLLGQRIEQEDGVGNAIRLIEEWMGTGQPHSKQGH
jgi:sterol 3beta-glucosyltransferase